MLAGAASSEFLGRKIDPVVVKRGFLRTAAIVAKAK